MQSTVKDATLRKSYVSFLLSCRLRRKLQKPSTAYRSTGSFIMRQPSCGSAGVMSMTRILTTLLLLAFQGIPFTQTNRESQSRPLVFTHVTVIDATGARAKPDMTVVVVG